MPSRESSELDHIREAYRERDAAPVASAYSWEEPGYRLYMQQLEPTLLGALVEAGQPAAGRRVLEVGCGSGYFLARILDYGAASAAGIDLMESRAGGARPATRSSTWSPATRATCPTRIGASTS